MLYIFKYTISINNKVTKGSVLFSKVDQQPVTFTSRAYLGEMRIPWKMTSSVHSVMQLYIPLTKTIWIHSTITAQFSGNIVKFPLCLPNVVDGQCNLIDLENNTSITWISSVIMPVTTSTKVVFKGQRTPNFRRLDVPTFVWQNVTPVCKWHHDLWSWLTVSHSVTSDTATCRQLHCSVTVSSNN